jgi:hypothetical protein
MNHMTVEFLARDHIAEMHREVAGPRIERPEAPPSGRMVIVDVARRLVVRPLTATLVGLRHG